VFSSTGLHGFPNRGTKLNLKDLDVRHIKSDENVEKVRNDRRLTVRISAELTSVPRSRLYKFRQKKLGDEESLCENRVQEPH
jgi:hypothetical protein